MALYAFNGISGPMARRLLTLDSVLPQILRNHVKYAQNVHKELTFSVI